MTAAQPTFADPQQVRELLGRVQAGSPRGQVEQCETHISWVFLTTDFAFKLKKPVHFEFLDFSTPVSRRQACEDEVRLNLRLASSVYLGVISICKDAQGGLCLDGEGEQIDWLVKMRRLPVQRSLDRLIAAGAVKGEETKQIADLLCRFFAHAVPADWEPETFRQSIDRHVRANCRDLLRAEHPLDGTQVQRVCGAQLQWLNLRRDVLESRLREGRVIEGHGDLRPEHVYLMSTPKVIDCVEFSEELRRVDVADELAFLAMECDLLGDSAVGKRILEVYTGMSGDRVSPRLLAFYKTYRACVRAKVFLLRSRQVPAEEAVRLRAVAESYLRLADTYVPVVDAPCLLVVRGLSGAGKSTVAEALARELGAEAIQTDQVRRRLFPDASPTPFGQGAYSEDKRRQVYDEVFRLASERLAQGLSVVLDGTFLSRALRCRALELAAHHQVPALLIPCACDPTIAQERVRERLAARSGLSDAQPDLVESQGRLNDPDDPQWPVCLVDTSEGLPVVLAKIYDSLRPRLGYD